MLLISSVRLTRGASILCLALALAIGCGDDDPMTDAGVDMSTDTFLPTDCDIDSDCDDGLFCNGAETCVEGMCVRPDAPECDDGIECSVDRCDEARDACSNSAPDVDGDGVGDMACVGADGPLGTDCDDSDATRFPGNTEVCDEPADGAMFGADEDCDPSTFGEVDMDGDGAFDAACTNGDEDTGTQSSGGDDCNDEDLTVLPGQLEICDSVDNDCDDEIDEEENSILWYPDTDGDLFGDPEGPEVLSCSPVPQHSIRPLDCDDTRASVSPVGTEACNGRDDDCDGSLDEGLEDCDPCDPNPCANDGTCRVLSMSEFVCECTTGFAGETCDASCDVTPAYPEAPEGRPSEDNHVRGAAFYAGTHLDDSTCDGPCIAAYAGDGQRCGDTRLVPIYESTLVAAGQSWRADWSAGGAKRIDRIEVYAVDEMGAVGLRGAEILIDGFVVATYPDDDAVSEVFLFDPPLYGSSVEVRKTREGRLFDLAEVEVWGEREESVTDIAFLGAVRQSSVLASSEAPATGGGSLNAGPMNAVDGNPDSVATTKAFVRAGSLSLDLEHPEGLPYNTGNADDAPTVGRGSAWWLLDLERPQTIRAVQIHRGDNAARLDGAEVYLIIDGELESPARWTLPAGVANGMERLRPDDPLENVTGIKIVSARESEMHPGTPDASLELREVRVWADTPLFGMEPLRDLTTRARADFLWEREVPPSLAQTPGGLIDGNLATGGSTGQVEGAYARIFFGRPHEIRRIETYNRSEYPSVPFFGPPGCPQRSLCGDTYGGCSYQPFGAEIRVLDEEGDGVGDSLATVGFEHFGPIDLPATANGVEFLREGLTFIETSACAPMSYFASAVISFRDVRIFGYWGAGGPSRYNYAALGRIADVTQTSTNGEDFGAERAVNGWRGDFSRTNDTAVTGFRVELSRPVLAETVRIFTPTVEGASGASVQIMVDGGAWEEIAILPERTLHTVRLPTDRLISQVRLRSSGPIQISELEVVGLPRF